MRGGALADVASVKSARACDAVGQQSATLACSNGGNGAGEDVAGVGGRREKGEDSRHALADAGHFGDSAPVGDDWIHEVKFDGYRMVCRIDRGDVRVYSRNGKEWTAALPSIVASLQQSGRGPGVARRRDCRRRRQGRDQLPAAAKRAVRIPGASNITYFVFDLLYQDGYDLRGVALTERKQLLRALVGHVRPRSALQRRRARLGRRILRSRPAL